MDSSRGSTCSVEGVIIGNAHEFGGHGLDETAGRGKGRGKGDSRASAGSGKSGKGKGKGRDRSSKGDGSRSPSSSRHSAGSVDGVLVEPDRKAPATEKVEPVTSPPEKEISSSTWVEYENVLTNCEKWICDRVEACARCCLCCRCSDPDKHADGASRPRKFSRWEGMDENVPERYQRWEGIRERNVITSVIFAWCGKGRKQPTKVERLHLFILYAAVWYLAYGLSLRRRSAPCRKAWVETCVPESFGGKCTTGCASSFILDETPEVYENFEDVIKSTKLGLDINRAKCVGMSSVGSPCEINMCADPGERTCFDKPDGTTGMCKCDPVYFRVLFEGILYCLLFKVLYLPYWYLFVMDTDKQCGHFCSVIIWSSVIVLYVILFTLGVVIMATYMGRVDGVLYETMWWFATFMVLCVLEVAKAFIFGFIVGTYIVSTCCGRIIGALWKFMLA